LQAPKVVCTVVSVRQHIDEALVHNSMMDLTTRSEEVDIKESLSVKEPAADEKELFLNQVTSYKLSYFFEHDKNIIRV
jgi:hypothetical protein